MKLLESILLFIGLILVISSITMIPLKLNEVQTLKGYNGEHLFTNAEYGQFKRAVIEYTSLTSISGTFRSIKVLDSHEPIIVSYTWLEVKQGFPYGKAMFNQHDGPPFDVLKPWFFFGGITLCCIATAIYSERKGI